MLSECCFYTSAVYYSGFLEYSDHPFDTTAHLKYPRMMKLGRGKKVFDQAAQYRRFSSAQLEDWFVNRIITSIDLTLAGLELGLLTMKRGEFSRFLFQPKYAYGDMGCPPYIPAAATVLYEVQILDYFDSAQVDDFCAVSSVGRNASART